MSKFEVHLKDRAREAALVASIPGFMEVFRDSVARQIDDGTDTIRVSKWGESFRDVRLILFFSKSEIECTRIKYDPHRWNRWPDVKPPEDVMLRVRYERRGGHKGETAGMFGAGDWELDDEDIYDLDEPVVVLLFRPFLSPGDSEEVNE